MRVTYLELQDIKSYQGPTRVELTEGVNAVCGANGSGKTTMLEAIGLTLFDFLPYPQQAFVREGQKSGTVRVGLEGRDEREYEIVRRIGAGGAYFVADAETGERIAERGEAVLDWIRREALDIEPGTDLKALFKNAVGVPQGLMTADFQQTATVRKAIFDPLLRVEEYRQAYEELRETARVLRGRTTSVEQDIAGLRTDTDRIPAKREEVERLRERVLAGSEQVAREEGYLAEREAARIVFDEISQRAIELEGKLKDARYDVQRYRDLVTVGSEGVEKARQAGQILKETEPSYHQVRQARRRREELEKRSHERNRLEKQLTREQATHDGISQQIERLDEELRVAEEASAKAAELLPRVQRQAHLERERQELDLLLHDLARWREDDTRLRRERDALEDARRSREPRLIQAREARRRAARLDGVQREVEAISERLAQLDPIKARLADLTVEGGDLKKERLKLQEAIENRDELTARLADRESVAARVDMLAAREGQLREKIVMTHAAIEYQHLARAELSRAHCPLLELQCPVVSQDRAALDRFEERADALTGNLQQLDGQLAGIKPELATAQSAAADAQKLHVDLVRLEGIDADLSRVESRLRTCRDTFQELSKLVEGEKEWRREQEARQGELRELQKAAEMAATLTVLEQQHEIDGQALAEKHAVLAELVLRLAEMGTARARAQELDRKLSDLGNPRTEEQRLVAIAGRRPEIAGSIAEAQGRMAEAAAKVKTLLAALEQYSSLDADIVETRRVEEEHTSRHERYLQCQEEASQLSARTAALRSSEAALVKADAGLARVERVLAEAVAGYKPEEHAQLKRDCDEALRLLIQQRERLEGIKGELSRAEEEMAFLRRAETKLRALVSEREGLVRTAQIVAFIRDTIRAAGPAITETLLRHISEGANDIYAEIVDDRAAELRWDREYEVLVQRGPETRKFAQLSGGEQMSAALAVRLALLKEMSEVDFAFFDEPTQNMDGERRNNLADQIRQLRGFEQLIVISHDDTFEHHTDNLIRLRKEHEITQVETG